MNLGLLLAGALVGCGLWLWTPDLPRGELEARYLRSQDDYRLVAGVRLHVRDSGPRTAPAILMLHGFGSSLDTWEAWAQDLQADYRVIRFDLPASGLSDLDPGGDYSDARSLEILAALMAQLDVPHATLIGNSMGGRIAWKFAALYPQRVDKLVLISPDGFASPGFEYGKAPHVTPTLELMRYALPKPLLRMSLAPAYGNPAHLRPAVVTRYYDQLRAPGARAAMIARMKQTLPEDPVPWLRRIQAPTLIVWGQKDGMIPFHNAADYQAAIAHSSLVSFPDLGHVPQEEAPAESLPPVRQFLATR
jgi:pimeloyl-ACP methyl ester carboxylesterase